MNVSGYKDLVRIFRKLLLRIFPMVSTIPLDMKFRTLAVITPHPDDEILGCAGLLGRAVAGDCDVRVLFLSAGTGAHHSCCDLSEQRVGDARHQLAIDAAAVVGISQEHLAFLDGQDGHLPNVNDKQFAGFAVQIHEHLAALQPEAVFCPHPFEGWSDHLAAEELTRAALNMLPAYTRPRLYHYCVWFWYSMPLKRAWRIDWRRARLLDISAQLPLKRQALRTYLDALVPCGNPWVGKLPPQFLRAFDWNKELYFEADITTLGTGK